jgi:hypothetical protein
MPGPMRARVDAYSGGTKWNILQPLSAILGEKVADVLVSAFLLSIRRGRICFAFYGLRNQDTMSRHRPISEYCLSSRPQRICFYQTLLPPYRMCISLKRKAPLIPLKRHKPALDPFAPSVLSLPQQRAHRRLLVPLVALNDIVFVE